MLERENPAGFALSPDRIERIYKGWLAEQVYLRSFHRFQLTNEVPDVNPIFPLRRHYTKASLTELRPRGSLKVLARKLLRGCRPKSTAGTGYVAPWPEMNPKALRELRSGLHTRTMREWFCKLDEPLPKRPRGRPKKIKIGVVK
jgi:hypothetical protein